MMFLTITSVFLFVALMTGGIIYIVMSRRSVVQERLGKDDAPCAGFQDNTGTGKKRPFRHSWIVSVNT